MYNNYNDETCNYYCKVYAKEYTLYFHLVYDYQAKFNNTIIYSSDISNHLSLFL